MAKDGTNRGGARAGAGAKRKPLADKIAEGNPGRRKLTVIDFQDTADLEGQPMPKPSAMLSATQKDGKTLVAAEVFEKIVSVIRIAVPYTGMIVLFNCFAKSTNVPIVSVIGHLKNTNAR